MAFSDFGISKVRSRRERRTLLLYRKVLKGYEAQYKYIVEKYPDYSKIDMTLLNLGDVQIALQEYDDAWISYEKLINEFPTSKLVNAAFKRIQKLEEARVQNPVADES